MLSEPCVGYLNYFAQLTEQQPNRWDGFDLSDPGARTTSLRDQLAFAGLALVILACLPEAEPAERERGLAGLTAITARLGQRRIWAESALVAERAGLLPDPMSEGNAGFAGQLAMLYALRAQLGIAPPEDEPVELRWSSDFCFRYGPADLTKSLVRRMRDWPDGGIPSHGTIVLPAEMAHVLWALCLSDRAFGGELMAEGRRWLSALEERVALRGPRMFGRSVFASEYDLKRRRGSFSGDALNDAWSLALLAPLAPELTRRLAERHWQSIERPTARTPLVLGFSSILALELDDAARAANLLAALEEQAPPQEDEGVRRLNGPAAPWLTALAAIGAAGGFTRLLELAPARREA